MLFKSLNAATATAGRPCFLSVGCNMGSASKYFLGLAEVVTEMISFWNARLSLMKF